LNKRIINSEQSVADTHSVRAPDRTPLRLLLRCSPLIPVVGAWVVIVFFGAGGPSVALNFSDYTLSAVPLVAGVSCIVTSRKNSDRFRLVWLLLGLSALSWGIGQCVWTYYEAIRGEAVPFPSLADAGYLTAVPLAASAMMLLPAGTRSMAGRARMVLDGLIVASGVFLVSWIVVLDRTFHTDAGGVLKQFLSLGYPGGDVVIVTIVLYAILRARQTGRRTPLSLSFVAIGLISLAVADSGFTYLTSIGAYYSGHPIDTGWFAGYLMILLASRTKSAARGEAETEADTAVQHSIGLLMPYAAVVLALVTSMIELARGVSVDAFISWDRSLIIALLVGRQILTLRENVMLTRDLEERVVQVQASEQRFSSLVQQSSDVVTVVDSDGVVIYQSETIHRVFGYDAEPLKGEPFASLLPATAIDKLRGALDKAIEERSTTVVIELPLHHADGRRCDAEISITNLLDDPNVGGLVLNTRDVSERRTLERQLVHQASHDPLTTLANRSVFRDRIDEVLQREAVADQRGAVLFLDLDGFKEINDSLGHAAGDILLTHVAARLRSCVRPSDTVARLGGDEFGILVDGDERDVDPHALAARILAALRAPFHIENREIQVRASIGIAPADTSIEASDQLLRNADLAMYRAKSAGGSTIERYDPDMHAQLVERLALEVDLRRALGRGELRLFYQPIVELKSGQPVGFEALLRWQHPTRGLIPPDKFIGIAEQTGLIQPIGRWVLHEACRQAMIWRTRHPEHAHLAMSVNISARQFANDDLIDDVANALEETGLPPECLELEMTETVLFEHSDDNINQLQRLKALGVMLAIDDFGTGYSSLAYLQMFSVHVLKIDRTFIAQLTESGADNELMRTILRIGQSLHMVTVAEGIETAEQASWTKALGCELGQGYHFARPLPPSEIDDLLISWDTRTAQAS
jgi:diguanylate cyclase (GGDEF)-like protein/PAS domain S-box-containing protein